MEEILKIGDRVKELGIKYNQLDGKVKVCGEIAEYISSISDLESRHKSHISEYLAGLVMHSIKAGEESMRELNSLEKILTNN